MKRNHVRPAIIAAVILVASVALAGCAPATHTVAGPGGHGSSGTHHTHSPSPSATSTPVATPTSTPFPESLGALPANALFRITAKGIQPDGATIDLVRDGLRAGPATASDTTLLNTQCNMSGSPEWQTLFPAGYLYLDATFTATVDTTTPTFNTNATISADLEDFQAAAFSGAYHEAQAPCAPGYFVLPGTIHGVGVVLEDRLGHRRERLGEHAGPIRILRRWQ